MNPLKPASESGSEVSDLLLARLFHSTQSVTFARVVVLAGERMLVRDNKRLMKARKREGVS